MSPNAIVDIAGKLIRGARCALHYEACERHRSRPSIHRISSIVRRGQSNETQHYAIGGKQFSWLFVPSMGRLLMLNLENHPKQHKTHPDQTDDRRHAAPEVADLPMRHHKPAVTIPTRLTLRFQITVAEKSGNQRCDEIAYAHPFQTDGNGSLEQWTQVRP